MKRLKNCLYDKDEKRWIEYTEEDYLALKKNAIENGNKLKRVNLYQVFVYCSH